MMRVSLGLLAICLVGVSWPQIRPELRAFVRDQTPGSALIVDLPQDIGALPRSVEGQYFALNACREALSTPLARLMEATERTRLITQCDALAAEALEAAPTLAYAYLVQALAADLDNRLGDMEAAYRSSETLSGDSVGLALTRVRMLLDHVDKIAPATRMALGRDVIRLARSHRARSQLGQFYVRHEDAQAFLTDTVTTLSPDLQRRFLSAVRRASQ